MKAYVVLLGLAVSVLASLSSYAEDVDNAPVVRSDELSEHPPLGHLGKPLGTLITIEGRYQLKVPGDRVPKAFNGRNLVIDAVDGKRLSESVIYEFTNDRLFEVIDPKHGDRFKLLGYESGYFTGAPKEAENLLTDTIARPRPVPFRFETTFHVLKDEVQRISERDAHKRSRKN